MNLIETGGVAAAREKVLTYMMICRFILVPALKSPRGRRSQALDKIMLYVKCENR